MTTTQKRGAVSLESALAGVLGVLALALVIAAVWRAAQFGMWLEAGWPGVLALAIGQVSLFALPGTYFVLEVADWIDPYGYGDAGPRLFTLIAVNTVAGLVPASIQFGALDSFAVWALNAGIPFAAAVMLGGALDQGGKLAHRSGR